MSAPVILITGGSRGIGAATARLAALRGYDVAFTYVRDATSAETVASEVRATGRRTLAIQADVSVEEDVARTFSTTAEQLGKPAALIVNSAVTGKNSRLDE